MRHFSNSKAGGMTISTSGIASASIDTQGFRHVRIIAVSDSTGSANTNTFVQHSDDNSTWVNITGLVAGTDYTISTSTSVTTSPKIIWDISLAGKRRYLKASYGTGSGRVAIISNLSDPIDGLDQNASIGAATYARG